MTAQRLIQRRPGQEPSPAGPREELDATMLDEGELHPPGADRGDGETGPAACGTWGSTAGALLVLQRGRCELTVGYNGKTQPQAAYWHPTLCRVWVAAGAPRCPCAKRRGNTAGEGRRVRRPIPVRARGAAVPVCPGSPDCPDQADGVWSHAAGSRRRMELVRAAPGTSSAGHRARRLGMGGACRRAGNQEKASPSFLRKKDRWATPHCSAHRIS